MSKKIGMLAVALCVASAFGQVSQQSSGPNSPNINGAGSVTVNDKDVTVKGSPAADALVSTAKDLTSEKKSLDTALQQARSSLDLSQKTLRDQLMALQKDLNDKLKADKKYASSLSQMETIQKQMQDAGNAANSKLQQSAGPISAKVAQDQALIDGLIPVVRKENSLPDTATFDVGTQTWKGK
jgi:hypothetical protein